EHVAHAALDLVAVEGGPLVGLAGVHLGDRHGPSGQFALAGPPHGLGAREAGRIERYANVGDDVLDGLEAADRTAELFAHLQVLHGVLEHGRGATDHLL